MSYSSFELLDHSRPIVVFGRDGQVGRALQICLNDLNVPAVFLGRADCDLTSESSIVEVLNHCQPKVIINAAAYTEVDKAESEPELAFAINAKAPELMAQYIAKVKDGLLIHYSADYVFGDSKKTSYVETDIPGPMSQLNAYGKSKLAGEVAIEKIFSVIQNETSSDSKNKPRYLILRTSWAYGDGDNFIRKILNLAFIQDGLCVVDDQIGVPTSASWLVEISLNLGFSRASSGIYHVVPDGEASWYHIAKLSIEEARQNGCHFTLKSENLQSISTLKYGSVAKRPHNSRMSNKKLRRALSEAGINVLIPHWSNQVKTYVKKYTESTMKTNSTLIV